MVRSFSLFCDKPICIVTAVWGFRRKRRKVFTFDKSIA
uniref:Uncharacterized protein n=1 Tax=Siphoviridae sp. cthHz3 TaxID=2825614 RepID=A0A8S5UYL2_9CAUD|nr:MAG TPA: hypothetical protein [Siphoviridae sp. cthHz3]DAZ30445.1 MAG TPA: hypothetical protein [Caudoviricetes sp.]